jgi:hypothetical protein
MSLDQRMRTARSNYLALGQQSATAARERQQPSRHLQRCLLAATAVLAMGVTLWQWQNDEKPSPVREITAAETSRPSTTLGGESTTTTPSRPPAERRPAPSGSIVDVIEDPAMVLDPPGPYTDGQIVSLTTPIGHSLDAIHPGPTMCATDATNQATTCSPLRAFVGDPKVTATDTSVSVSVPISRMIFTPKGSRDCNEATITCRLFVRGSDLTFGATSRLTFSGQPRDPTVNVTVNNGSAAGKFVITPTGFVVDSSWSTIPPSFEMQPEQPDGSPYARVCSFSAPIPPVTPYGSDLWNTATYPRHPATSENCSLDDTTNQRRQGSRPDDPIELMVPAEFYGYGGWTNCLVEQCFVVVSAPVLIEARNDGGLYVGSYDVGAALLNFPPGTPQPARPSMTIREPGPYRVGDVITIDLRNMIGDRPTTLSMCFGDDPWACGMFESTEGAGDRTVTFEIPWQLADCGEGHCYLQVNSNSEGLAPPAVVPLPIKPPGGG